jgi:glutamyl-tRNA synthetase
MWCHLSVFLKPSGRGKMSKRESSELLAEGHSIFVRDLRELGYIQEGVLNWIALMGASFDEKRDVFSLNELIERFSLAHLNPAPAAINFTKEDHFNGVHIRRLSPQDLAERLLPFFAKAGLDADLSTLLRMVPLVQERIVTLSEGPQIAGFFFREEVRPDPQDLLGKGLSARQSADALRAARELLSGFENLADAAVEPRSRQLAAALALEPGQLFGILRAAVTGQTVSPPLFGTMAIVGKERVLRRLDEAEEILRGMT